MYPLFRSQVTEKVTTVGLTEHKVYVLEFFSTQRSDGDWKLEYSRELQRSELDKMSVTKMVAVLKQNYYRFQELAKLQVTMFMADGVMYGEPEFEHLSKELTGQLANKELKGFLGCDTEWTFDLLEMFNSDSTRMVFFKENEAVIIGEYIYLDGKAVDKFNPDIQNYDEIREYFNVRRLFLGEKVVSEE